GSGSPIKSFKEYDSHWKSINHSHYTALCIANEHNSSQTCVYCFKKLSHPLKIVKEKGKTKVKTVNSGFQCDNIDCILYKNNKQSQSRD
ncbi:hypothetical protein K501DRAFT_178769, partial [Backusella circina FSU 941]